MTLIIEHYQRIIETIGMVSLATFLISLLLIPFLLSKAPVNYFMIHIGHHPKDSCHKGWFCHLVKVLKNGLGTILLGAGIAMLFLPGQGILTILLALTLLDVPGKERFLERAISKPSIQHGLNWIRKKSNKAPFIFPDGGKK